MVLCKSLPLLDNFKIILKQEVIGGSFFNMAKIASQNKLRSKSHNHVGS